MDTQVIFQFPKAVTQAINGAPVAAVKEAATAAAATILSRSPSTQPTTDESLEAAVALVFAQALRLGADRARLADLLATTVIASDRAEALATAFGASLSTGPSAVLQYQLASMQALQDGPLPRLAGIEWSTGHRLGDRAQDPPESAAASLSLQLVLADGRRSAPISCSADEAHGLLSTFREMIREVQRVSAP